MQPFRSFIQGIIHFWINLAGKKVDYNVQPHLKGPAAEDQQIGDQFYRKIAKNEDLGIQTAEDAGLMKNFKDAFDANNPHLPILDPAVAEFYEKTSLFKLEVWAKWKAPVSWFAKLIIKTLSSEIMQLNIPLDPMDTSYGMSSSVIHLIDSEGNLKYACWNRSSNKTSEVVYAGLYSPVTIKNEPYVRVVFPLPMGNVTVILKGVIQEDGSIKLISNQNKYPQTGYFRIHKNKNGRVKARKIPIHEVIHVFRAKDGQLRTDHTFSFRSLQFLQLHYKIYR
ncbi:hypothetical protein GYB22_01370 [bacterium]|nr:hypothetical protein [bacterium]